ncbi:uncharacterized protein [Polyergus mexicanus]|uniref:uncharacterized protein n=1 Tax=Polyergus mexicanus TaxID=615972 RepID=UPI0038B6650C
MSRILVSCFLFLTLVCTYALASVPEDAKQKRGIIGNDGWIGIPNPYGYGYGHSWLVDHTPWKGLKLQSINRLHLADALPIYGRDSIALTSGILKAPIYITKHVVLEKPVPVPEPIIIEKPYHVPVPIEKIIHKPFPVPVPVPQAVPIPVKQPIAVPVHQPYPVPVKHPVPVLVPVPIPTHPFPPSLPLIPAGGFPGGIYVRDYTPSHLYALPYHPPSNALDLDHGIAALHDGFGHVLTHDYGHGYEYDHHHPHAHVHAHADHLVHEHDHKKRKTDKN